MRARPHMDTAASQLNRLRGKYMATPRSRFSWEALNVTNTSSWSCGWAKCYFPAQRYLVLGVGRQLSERENEGWLVGRLQSGERTWFHDFGFINTQGAKLPSSSGDELQGVLQWRRAWVFAEELQKRFGVEHLLFGPPRLATLTPEQAKSLNSDLVTAIERGDIRVFRDRRPHWSTGKVGGVSEYFTAGSHPVQAVHPCALPACIVLGCHDAKAHSFAKGLKYFIEHAPNKTKLSHTLKQNLALVAAMVKAHPCLKIDFQVFLRNDGAVLNIDLDRCDEYSTAGPHAPLSASQKLELEKVPGLCQGSPNSRQANLDKALKQLYERLRQ